MWCNKDDKTEPVISAKEHIRSAHREFNLILPETAILFFMGKGVTYLCENYDVQKLSEPLPRFLYKCPVWNIAGEEICFLDGGRGAPQACDTVETLAALGVKNIIAVGMFGAIDRKVNIGETISPERAYVEEGTSLHYYESIEYTEPDSTLLEIASKRLEIKTYPIVSTDAPYRQTFWKEQMWREAGAVGVDMETSAVLSVTKYLGLKSVALLMASDIHPMNSDEPKWEWCMTKEMRYKLADNSVSLARLINTKD